MRNSANTYMVIVGVILALGGVAVVQLLVPEFQEMFVSFGAELPALTRAFIDGRNALWALPLSVPIAAFLVRERDAKDKRRGIVALIIGIAIGIGLPMLCAFSMYLPIFGMAGAAP